MSTPRPVDLLALAAALRKARGPSARARVAKRLRDGVDQWLADELAQHGRCLACGYKRRARKADLVPA